MAGGHSLLPLMKVRLARPEALVDIGRIAALRQITLKGKRVIIGALVTHASLASSPDLARACPLLVEAARVVGDPAVRNRGTIGGNVVHADPGSDLPTALTALGAAFIVTGPRGRRSVPAAAFFTGYMQSAVADDEMLTAVEVPVARSGQGMAYAKMFNPASRYAMVSAAAVVEVQGARCVQAIVAVGGLVPSPRRATSVEQAVVGKTLTPPTIADAASRVMKDLGGDILGDIHASAEYRGAMASVYVERALAMAFQRAASA